MFRFLHASASLLFLTVTATVKPLSCPSGDTLGLRAGLQSAPSTREAPQMGGRYPSVCAQLGQVFSSKKRAEFSSGVKRVPVPHLQSQSWGSDSLEPQEKEKQSSVPSVTVRVTPEMENCCIQVKPYKINSL